MSNATEWADKFYNLLSEVRDDVLEAINLNWSRYQDKGCLESELLKLERIDNALKEYETWQELQKV